MSGLVQLNFFVARSLFTAFSHVGAYFHQKISPAELSSKEVTSKLQERVNQTSERLIAADNNEVEEDHDIILLEDSIEESEYHVDMLKLRSHLSSLPKFKPSTTTKDAFSRRETLNTPKTRLNMPKKAMDKQYVKLNTTYSCKSKVSSRGKSTLGVIEEPENIIEEVEVDDHQNKDLNNQKEQVSGQQVVQVTRNSHESAEVVINYFNPTMSTDNFFRSNVSLTTSTSIPKPEPYMLEESWLPILQLKRTEGVHNMDTVADNEEPERLTRRYLPSENDLSPVSSKTSGDWWM